MLFIKFKCPRCGETFNKLRFLVTSDSKYTCPKCGEENVSPIKEDLDMLKVEEKDNCSSHG
ncbi:MAG: FmdB family zinc ribbon protein [Armatimonadota bacterium]|nr:hypothetical protein [bacterium]